MMDSTHVDSRTVWLQLRQRVKELIRSRAKCRNVQEIDSTIGAFDGSIGQQNCSRHILWIAPWPAVEGSKAHVIPQRHVIRNICTNISCRLHHAKSFFFRHFDAGRQCRLYNSLLRCQIPLACQVACWNELKDLVDLGSQRFIETRNHFGQILRIEEMLHHAVCQWNTDLKL